MKPSTFPCKYEKEDGIISVNPTRIEWKSNTSKTIITTPFEELQSNFLFLILDPNVSEVTKKIQIVQMTNNQKKQYIYVFEDIKDLKNVTELIKLIRKAIKEKNMKPQRTNDPLKMRYLQDYPEENRIYEELVLTDEKPQQTSNVINDLKHLHDQTPQGNTQKINVTPEMKKNVFLQFPAVKKAYENKVPHEIPEKQFWIQFFQSAYFHRKKDFKTKEADRLFEVYERQITRQKDSLDIQSDLTKNEISDEGFGIRKDEMTAPSNLDPFGEILHDLNKESTQFVKLNRKETIDVEEEIHEDYRDLKLDRKDVGLREEVSERNPTHFNTFESEKNDLIIKGIEKIDNRLYHDIMQEVYEIIKSKDLFQEDMKITDEFLNEYKKYFIILNELFVHFWKYGKGEKLIQSIETYQKKLIQLKEKNSKFSHLINQLLTSIESILGNKKRKLEEEDLDPNKKVASSVEVINVD